MNNEWPHTYIGCFQIDGEPVAMGRPRFTKTGRVYTPKKTEDALNFIASIAAENIPYRESEALFELSVTFYFKRPKRLKEGQTVRKGTKPDLDNLIKTVKDAITRSGIWKDDSQVVSLRASKFYCASDTEPFTSVFLYPVRNDTLPF